MRHILTTSIITILLAVSPTFAGVCDVDPAKHLDLPKGMTLNILDKHELNGLCQMVVQPFGFPKPLTIYTGKDFVIVGSMFKDKKDLGMATIATLQRANFTEYRTNLDDLTVFTYTPDHYTRTAYVFTNPNCGHCNHAKQSMQTFADTHNIRLQFLFLRLRSTPSPKITAAICGSFTMENYLTDNYPETPACPKANQVIKDTAELAGKLGVTGTPAVILDNGSLIVGFDQQRILKELETKVSRKN